jgi:hypothetical protein
VKERAAISRDSSGQLILTTPGSRAATGVVELYRGPAPAPRFKDPQLCATGAEFLDGGFVAAFVSAAGGPRIRFYHDDRAPRDAAMAGNLENQIGFYPCGAAFVLARFNEDKSLGVSVWDI